MQKFEVLKEESMEGFGVPVIEGMTIKIVVSIADMDCKIYIEDQLQGVAFTGLQMTPENERLYIDFEGKDD